MNNYDEIIKLINFLPKEINNYINEIIKDDKIDINDLVPISNLIKYLVDHFNNIKDVQIKKIDNEIIIFVIKLIIILIIHKYGNLNDYLQIINLSFNCLSLVITSNNIKSSIFCCF
jgi:hypothetical protein